MPARFREVLMRNYDERLMITPVWHNCLRVYPFREWEKRESRLLEMPNKPPHVVRMIRYLVGGINACQLDKNGRILLPAKLRADLGIKKEIVMNGMLDFFEIWNRKTWEQESMPSVEDQNIFDQTFNELGFY
jgi:MraZ protein